MGYVIKRDGSKEDLDIKKIQHFTELATNGIDGVSQNELELDLRIHFTNGLRTADIQKTLINTAYSKIDIDTPNWTYVAARLHIMDIKHDVTGTDEYDTLRDYIDRMIKNNRLKRG